MAACVKLTVSITPRSAHALTSRLYRRRGGRCYRGLAGQRAALAARSNRAPKPTTAAFTVMGVTFHLTSFGRGMDPSSITDFKGLVGVADVQGKGTARNPDGSVETLLFDTDMRFMQGVYVGQDGAVHRGTFGFV